ncbi:transcriptional regulator [Brevibacillus fluminis]|uniref:Transcriptional regulator n=1 Tax=Brevibacillus fluminis TaxID=511487 RepID=A0A3M8DWN5_9BACL|nr:helix-turn-helix domain-containing protein [Brevibacillus fluminis]RNB92536.1 transcriptional regulator [Brevibacillus fluminis]
MPKPYNQHCNIAKTLDIIGDRWSLLIIRDLFYGVNKFNDLKESLTGISASVLSERLQALERHGMIEARLYSDHPPRYEYGLTETGRSLKSVLITLAIWGNQHFDEKYVEVLHQKCGHEMVRVDFRCPHCEETVRDFSFSPVKEKN